MCVLISRIEANANDHVNECDDIIADLLFLKVAKEPQEYNISYSKRTRHLSVMLVHDTHARARAHTHVQVTANVQP